MSHDIVFIVATRRTALTRQCLRQADRISCSRASTSRCPRYA
jgi:hypothetical protein